MNIEGIIDSLLDLIRIELIAKTNLSVNASIGDTTLTVVNSFHFQAGQEIVLIDYNYNVEGTSHYKVYEYAVVKSVTNTTTIVLESPLQSNWLLSDQSFIQKTIAHSPLYENNLLYGDREVIPTDEVAITVEPVSLSNDWIYLQGGLSEESRLKISIYGQDISTEHGLRILNKYTKAVYDLLNTSLHLNVNDYQTPITRDINVNDGSFYICNTTTNDEEFIVGKSYAFQDNDSPRCAWYEITSKSYVGDEICLVVDCLMNKQILKSEYGLAIRMKRYLYDSRVDSLTFGVIQKSSAILRAAELSWFGKEVNEISFPQYDRKTIEFEIDEVCLSSSSSSSS
jgi:hypothetical protein